MSLPTDLVTSTPVILCLGSGGVGKTTTAAALGLAAAREGRRAVVLTIDPARRLADAMGLSSGVSRRTTELGLDNEAHRVDGPWPGELWAAMLDPAATFDGLIRHHCESDEQAEQILGNRLYQNLTESLSGTNEYMAAERLRDLHLDPRFDLVIVDTPPSHHAFDFLDSPNRIVRFFDHRLYQAVLAPRRGVLRAVSTATQGVVRTLSRFVGADFVTDVIDFFSAFEGIDEGFRNRAAEVEALLRSSETACVLITAPRDEPLREARWIAANLAQRAQSVTLLLVNRMTPRFSSPVGGSSHAAEHGADPLTINLAQLTALADAEEAVVDELAAAIGATTALMVYEQVSSITDLDGLGELGDQLRAAAYVDDN